MNSRYYNPEWGRFINADGLVGTTGELLSANMFAYCGNNPVNREDPSGYLWGFIKEFIAQVSNAINALKPVYAVAGGCAIGDGPLPIGDLIGAAIAAVGTIGAVGYAGYKTITSSRESARSTPIATDTTKKNEDKIIYRYGGTNPGNFVPTKRDVATNTGLSFSTIPRPGAAMTTIGALNATGVVSAVQDGATHVSVTPIGGTIKQWNEAGSSSIWTQAVKSVVVKWDGGK